MQGRVKSQLESQPEKSQVDSTHRDTLTYPSHCSIKVKNVLFFFLIVLFLRIISKFVLSTLFTDRRNLNITQWVGAQRM